MLRVLSSPKRLCDGVTRRDLLHAGGLGLCGLGLADLLRIQASASTASDFGPGFGKAKRCILLYLYGAPSQLETFDMKPSAPLEIRGTMQPIPSNVAGLDVCEHLPKLSRVMDRATVVRSVTHEFPLHGVAFATTGIPAIDAPLELSPADLRHQPYFGSIVDYVDRQTGRERAADMPQNVALPFPFSSQRVGEVARAGPYASYLGSGYNPIWTEFQGRSSRSVIKTLGPKTLDCHDPYVGCTPDSTFQLAAAGQIPDLTIDRLNRRRTLLEQFDVTRRDLDRTTSGQSLSQFQDIAYSLINSTKVSEALDVRRENLATRDLYGMTLFGQGCLAARRMIEAGTRLVSVFWDEYGLAGDAWDTHYNHYPRMLDQLLPQFDLAMSGLLIDLDQRGLLDDTLVVCLSEHGRTPKLSDGNGGGRDHWSRAYSALFAGGGIARGKVVGATDKYAGDVAERPVSPKDLLATMYHCLGIPPHSRIPDRTGRPMGLLPDQADIVPEMLA